MSSEIKNVHPRQGAMGTETTAISIPGILILITISVLGIACASMLLTPKCKLNKSDKWFAGLLLGFSIIGCLMGLGGLYAKFQ